MASMSVPIPRTSWSAESGPHGGSDAARGFGSAAGIGTGGGDARLGGGRATDAATES